MVLCFPWSGYRTQEGGKVKPDLQIMMSGIEMPIKQIETTKVNLRWNGFPRQSINPLVFLVPGVAFDPMPPHIVFICSPIELPP